MSGCFGCDHKNPAGLGMRFFRDREGRLGAACTPNNSHGGLGNIVNGGLVATFGEELAAAAAGGRGDGGLVVTHLDVKYERPAYIGSEMSGLVTSTAQDKRAVDVSVDVSSGGQRVAVLTASFILISEARLRELSGIDLAAAPVCLVAARQPLPTEG